MDRNEAHQYLQQSLRHIKQRIMGQENVIEQLICCFVAGGHILMTGAPGLGKTLLVKVMAFPGGPRVWSLLYSCLLFLYHP